MSITRFSRLPTKIAFPGYIVAPNGGIVIYLCSLGIQDNMSDDIASVLYTSLAAALNVCRSNRGDVIVALPGHTESVTATATTFKAGVTVLGIGNGDERPTFNWTVAGSTWTIAVANVAFENCVLNLAATAATTVTKAISISGAKSRIQDCEINMGSGAAQLATIGIEYVTGADRAVLENNNIFSNAASANTNCIKLTNAIDSMRVIGNVISVGMTATTSSVITMTTAPTNIIIKNNELTNSIAASTKALVGVAAATGQVSYNDVFIQAATGGATAIGTPGSLGFCQNFGCAGNGSGLLTPAAGS